MPQFLMPYTRLLFAVFIVATASCGGDDVYYAIPPISPANLTMVQGSTIQLTVALNRSAKRELHLTAKVDSPFSSSVTVYPDTLVFPVGTLHLPIEVSAHAATAGQFAAVRFALLELPEVTQTWLVNVE